MMIALFTHNLLFFSIVIYKTIKNNIILLFSYYPLF